MDKPTKPDGLIAPGLAWRRRARQWTAYWVARVDLVDKGYPTKTVHLWPTKQSGAMPTDAEWREIGTRCAIEQGKMLAWSDTGGETKWDARMVYDGSLESLIRIYVEHPVSTYRELRHHTTKRYDSALRTIREAFGGAHVPSLTNPDFKLMHAAFAEPETAGGPRRLSRAYGLMTILRLVITFGKGLKLAGCEETRSILHDVRLPMPKPRTSIMMPDQVAAVIAEAHRQGFASIALAQALQDGLILRQKDVIGEWVPTSEPGLSDVHAAGQKWMLGLRWEEMDGTVVKHRLSKSLQGRSAVAEKGGGTVKSFDLALRPAVMAELAGIPEERRHGPMVICEYSGLPWRAKQFQRIWRRIARAAGIPDHVQNRDTRAGGITHGRRSGARLEDMRHAAGHSQIGTTAGYDRADLDEDRKVAQLRWPKE